MNIIDWLATHPGLVQGITLYVFSSLIFGIVLGKISKAREAHADIKRGD